MAGSFASRPLATCVVRINGRGRAAELGLTVAGEKRRNDGHAGGEGHRGGAEGAKSAKRQTRSVKALHLLVKHRDSRRPASWKEPEGITRSKEDALAMVEVGCADPLPSSFHLSYQPLPPVLPHLYLDRLTSTPATAQGLP